jgi:hypothetical protein
MCIDHLSRASIAITLGKDDWHLVFIWCCGLSCHVASQSFKHVIVEPGITGPGYERGGRAGGGPGGPGGRGYVRGRGRMGPGRGRGDPNY